MEKIKILFISSSPIGLDRLNLKEEFNSIDSEIRKSTYSQYFELIQSWETSISEIQDLFLRYSPDIVHFSGHGNKKSEIILQKPNGTAAPVSTDALEILFNSFKSTIQCVVLNMCYSSDQAQSISNSINFVIGAEGEIGDQNAIEFSKSFYRGISNKKSIKQSFILAQNAISLPARNVNNLTHLYSKIAADYSFVSRRMQANKIIEDTKKYAPAVAGGYILARVWDKVKSSPISGSDGEAHKFVYHTVDQLKNVLNDNGLLSEVAEQAGDSFLSWLDDALDFLPR
jgi:hypothetical protein